MLSLCVPWWIAFACQMCVCVDENTCELVRRKPKSKNSFTLYGAQCRALTHFECHLIWHIHFYVFIHSKGTFIYIRLRLICLIFMSFACICIYLHFVTGCAFVDILRIIYEWFTCTQTQNTHTHMCTNLLKCLAYPFWSSFLVAGLMWALWQNLVWFKIYLKPLDYIIWLDFIVQSGWKYWCI